MRWSHAPRGRDPLLFAMPLLLTIMAIPILGERVGWHRWAAVIVGLCGVIIVVRPGQAELGLGHLAAVFAAFWLVETRGLTVVYNATMNLLSGFLIPIVWFPDWLLTIARATPFPSMIQTPIDTLSGRVPPAEALGLIGVQIGWTAVLALAAWAMLRAGTRSLEVQGG